MNNDDERAKLLLDVENMLSDKRFLRKYPYDAKSDPLNIRDLSKIDLSNGDLIEDVGDLLFGEDGYNPCDFIEGEIPCPCCMKTEVTKDDVLKHLLKRCGMSLDDVKDEIFKQ
jgi:hypothetical protein